MQLNIKDIADKADMIILSSGQLSAVTIAIALTLNKIYAQDRIRCMFIDDPIQTMRKFFGLYPL